MNDLIIFKNFVKKFKAKKIGPVNCSIERSKITAILGPSGSGKSVILNSILGIIKRFSGDISIDNISRKKGNYYTINRKIGYYTQMDFSLYEISCYKFLFDICITMGISKKDSIQRIEHWLKYFELWESKDKKIKSFSWGMKNRVNLILCFIKDPDILILDEPGANLDSLWRNKIKTLLMECKKNKKTVIITVHNIDEIVDIVDDLIIIDNGECVFNGKKSSLNIYEKYKVYIKNTFDLETFKVFLKEKNIKIFKYDEFENSIIVAFDTYQQINFLFLYLVKNKLPLKNIVRLPINIESIQKALKN
ncbi:ATP-binding cassette domain-containing protein [Spiroplasma floricola]|nr:ABC transporter ATP-binding protein [Spiroplasma floricola]